MSRFELVEKVYFEVLSRPEAERLEFLREVCGDDRVLFDEIVSLLEYEGKSADFIEAPPLALAASIIGVEAPREMAGRTLANYRIESLIGAGGMGEVYLALDQTLGRQVALKILPARFSGDPERRRRFEREARAASNLNHPNIITVHGFGEADGLDFIASEFIEGETLRERLAGGPLTPDEVIVTSLQALAGIEAAHSKGVFHRDIKPANIMIRHDGIVKMLDFGLAKITEGFDDFASRDAQSRFGAMGTVQYMSPEQALGKTLDGRSDIFSLGVTIYEMLVGRLPFGGTTDAAVYDAILHDRPPPLAEVAPDLSADWQSLIDRAMAKEPDARYQTAAEFRDDLVRLRDGERLSRPAPPRRQRVFSKTAAAAAAAVIAVVAIAAVGFAGFRLWRADRAFDPRAVAYSQLTDQAGQELFPSLTPDGTGIIYTARDGGDWDIFFRKFGSDEAPVNLTADSAASDRQAVFSPDGAKIAFRSDRDGAGGIYVMDLDGRNRRLVIAEGYYPCWSPDGRELVVSSGDFENPAERFLGSYLFAVNVETGARRDVLVTEDSIQGNWSPDGSRIAYWFYGPGGVRQIRTVSADGTGDVVPVTDGTSVDWNPVWSPDGKYLYFASNRGGSMNLWRIAVDQRSGRVLGDAEAVSTPTTYFEHLTFSRDGKVFAFAQGSETVNIERADFDPASGKVISGLTPVSQGAKTFRNPSVSPDAKFIAFDSFSNRQEDIFIMRSDGTGIRQLTNDAFKDRAPRWAPDGQSVVFYSSRSGKYEVWQINADGTGLRQLTDTPTPQHLAVWSPDGRSLLVNQDGSFPVIYQVRDGGRLTDPRKLIVAPNDNTYTMAMSWTSDGTRLATSRYASDVETEGVEVYDLRTDRYQILNESGIDPFWLGDDRRVVYSDEGRLMLIDSETREKSELLTVAPNEIQLFSIAPGDRAIFISIRRKEADIWIGKTE